MPLEVEHKAWWAIKAINLDEMKSGEARLLALNELEEFRLQAYHNASIYKEKVKRWHDNRIASKELHVGKKVLLFNSRFKLFPGKLKSKWSGPFVVHALFLYGVMEMKNEGDGSIFKVNVHRVKPYIDVGVDWQKEVGSISFIK